MSIYKFTKNGSLERPRNVSEQTFNSDPFGTEYDYNPSETVLNIYHFSSSNYNDSDYKKLRALKNTINYYSADDNYKKFDNFYNKPSALILFNSYHFGDGIEKGSIYLGYYYTGSLIDYAQDSRTNGILYNKDDTEVGIVLYKEGIILLNHTGTLSNSITASFTGSNNSYTVQDEHPRWIYFGANDNDEEKFSFEPQYLMSDATPANLIFVEANKNSLNHSNNISYLDSSSIAQGGITNNYGYYVSWPNHFRENDKISIKNTVKSPFVSGSANFQKETYITRIGLYDKDKKLIGYASLATPVRKTENREFLFKLKLDI